MRRFASRPALWSLRPLFAVLPLAGCWIGAQGPRPLDDKDRHAIRANDSAYVAAWLRDDTTGVLATLTSDAVLVPGGLRPLVGQLAARDFWFPTDGSHTKLSTFVRAIDEIDGAGDVAYVRGTDSLAFTYAKDGKTNEQSMRSVTLAVVRRQPSGAWRISRMMWATITH